MSSFPKQARDTFLNWFAPVRPDVVNLAAQISRSADAGPFPRLLYAATCPKCRFLARCVVFLSLGSIRGIPLDKPQWQEFYARLPEARGYPVLIVRNRVAFGPHVFPGVPLVVIESWIVRLSKLAGDKQLQASHKVLGGKDGKHAQSA